MENLNIIEHDEDDNSVENIFQDLVGKFIVYNQDTLRHLSDILKRENSKYKYLNNGNSSFTVDQFNIGGLQHNIKFLIKNKDRLFLVYLRYIYKLRKFLTLILNKFIIKTALDVNDILMLSEIKKDLVPKIDALIHDLQTYYHQEGLNIDYFLYLRMDNPKVWATATNLKPTPGTFKLFQVLSDEKTAKLLKNFSKTFVDSISHFSHTGTLDPYGQRDFLMNDRVRGVSYDYSHYPEFRKYTGWSKDKLRESLIEAGIFDTRVKPLNDSYLHIFPKLQELFIKQTPAIRSSKPDSIIKAIPKYALETIYAHTIDTTPNWKEIINSGVHIKAIRDLAEKELKIYIDNDDELLRVLSIIARNQ